MLSTPPIAFLRTGAAVDASWSHLLDVRITTRDRRQPRNRQPVQICCVDGCHGQRRYSSGLCDTHHRRMQRYGSLDAPPRKQRPVQPMCSVDGCQSQAHAHGYCNTHYHRWQKHGSAHISLINMPRRTA